MKKTALHGFSTKTINIETNAGQLKYNLGDFQENFFGANSTILAISVRYNPDSNDVYSSDDRPLISKDECSAGYLTLVKSGKSENIIFEKNLYAISRSSLYYSPNNEDIFIPPCDLNWNQSFIEFGTSVSFDGSKDIELNVYYITDCQKPVEANIKLDVCKEYNATSQLSIQVNVKAGKNTFKISGGSNPLPSCARIIGINFNNFPYRGINGEEPVEISNFLGAAFLFLKVGSRELLEACPVQDLAPIQRLGLPYFPIEPTPTESIQWSEAKIKLSNKSLAQDNYTFLITLYYENL